jgi:hypothetical protein
MHTIMHTHTPNASPLNHRGQCLSINHCFPFIASSFFSDIRLLIRIMSTSEYHKDFSDPTADLVIKCQDGVHFRVHSYILKAHR